MLLFISILLGSIGIIILFFLIRDMPDLSTISQFKRQQSISIKDQKGNMLASYGDLFGKPVSIKTLPPYVVQALLVVEDRKFYNHFGVDVLGIIRAVIINKRSGRIVQGGSTITQQLARNLLISSKKFSPTDRSYKRKAQELFLAFQLERRLSKNQILTLYLNRVYFGSGTYGIDAASKKYFHKKPTDLSVFESAGLIGLLKASSKYSPHRNSKKFIDRTEKVLKLMEENGYIKDYKQYLSESSDLKPPERGSMYFTDWIRDSINLYVDTDDDLEVTVSLDLKTQEIAEKAVKENMEKHGKEYKATEAGLVVMKTNGEVKAMVGGRGHNFSQFNRVTQALRQPGSSIKPFVYIAYMEEFGKYMDSYMSDMPFQKGKWKPKNFRYQSKGEITLLEAITKSVNAVTIRLAEKTGIKKVKNVIERFGIFSNMPDNLTIALGTGEITLLDLTSAYAAFANHGKMVHPHGILVIKNKKGKILYKHKNYETAKIISNKILSEMMIALKSIVASGSGARARIGNKVYGKTGTTNDSRDTWFISFIEDGVVTGVWVGNDDNTKMSNEAQGGRLPAMIAKTFYTNAY